MWVPVFGREKLYDVSMDREALSDVPPCMCCVADLPPTASGDPAAWRDPEVEIERREFAPGEAKYEEFGEATDVEVNKPVAAKAEISVGVNAIPLTEVEVGFAFITERYFSVTSSVSAVARLSVLPLTLKVFCKFFVLPNKRLPLLYACQSITNSRSTCSTMRNRHSPQDAGLCELRNLTLNLR